MFILIISALVLRKTAFVSGKENVMIKKGLNAKKVQLYFASLQQNDQTVYRIKSFT